MGTDYAEKERAFIAGLREDTGRDLSGWMQAIEQESLSNRNDIIDWLRQQGFPFARASWLERIHHNGGRLIYADDEVVGAAPLAAAIAREGAQKPQVFPFAGKPPVRQAVDGAVSEIAAPPRIVSTRPAPIAPGTDVSIAELLTAAKGLRPLAEVLISEIRQTVGATAIAAEPPLIIFAAPKRYAALLTSAKELRLFADFGGGTARVKRVEPTKSFAPPYAQAIVLNDVRQIDAELLALVATAHQRSSA